MHTNRPFAVSRKEVAFACMLGILGLGAACGWCTWRSHTRFFKPVNGAGNRLRSIVESTKGAVEEKISEAHQLLTDTEFKPLWIRIGDRFGPASKTREI